MAPGVFALSPNKKFHRLRQRLLRSGVIYRQTSAAANGATRAHEREREREGERERKQTCAPPSMFTSSRSKRWLEELSFVALAFASSFRGLACGQRGRINGDFVSRIRLLAESRGAAWRGLTRDARSGPDLATRHNISTVNRRVESEKVSPPETLSRPAYQPDVT